MLPSDHARNGDAPAIGEDLLKLLANDTRMEILQYIWNEFDFERNHLVSVRFRRGRH